MLGFMTPPVGSYDWLFDVLFGAAAATGPDGQAAPVTWAPHGDLPAGYRPAGQFAVMPGGRDRAFMVSLTSRRGAASALTSYNALRPAARRAVRTALGLALRSGAASPFLRTRIDIGVRETLTGPQAREALISGHVAGLLGRPDVVLAFGGGSGPYRKPVLQVFSTDGIPLAYVKVGWNAWTRDAVRREAEGLRAYAARRGTGGSAPQDCCTTASGGASNCWSPRRCRPWSGLRPPSCPPRRSCARSASCRRLRRPRSATVAGGPR